MLTLYALGLSPKIDPAAPEAYVADYRVQAALADDEEALLDNLDLLLTHGGLQDETRERIRQVLVALGSESQEDRDLRARIASIMVMTSPEYIVLR